jgi:hypothetical protein
MPAIFSGQGNPMNAVTNNRYSEAWRRIGEQTIKPTLFCHRRRQFAFVRRFDSAAAFIADRRAVSGRSEVPRNSSSKCACRA